MKSCQSPFFVLTMVLCLLSLSTQAQKLHFIIFADTDDPKIGGANLKTYTYLTQDLAPAIAKQAGLTLSLSSFFGNQCRVSQLDATLASLMPGPDDVVFFYFAGHGWNGRQNEYPSLIFGNANTDRSTLEASSRNLFDLYQQLRTRNARLTIAIGEACNKERSDAPPQALVSSRPVEIMKNTTYSPQKFQSLFRASRGGLVMASSKRGQFSHTDPKGGWMGVAWQNAVLQLLSDGQAGPATWPGLLSRVVRETESMGQKNAQPQNPLLKNEIVPCPTCLANPTANRPAPVAVAPSANAPCAPVHSYVNETALAGIREDLPLLKEMYEQINSDNAEQYAARFALLYQNQKPFYDKLGDMVFYKASQMPAHCRPEFDRNVSWIKESSSEIKQRYAIVNKFSQKPLQLVAQARSELPSMIRRLEEILEELDK